MKVHNYWIKTAIFLLFVFGLSTGVFAESKITVRGQGSYSRAEVKVSLNENIYYGGKNKIKFKAKGLKSRGTYTVWLLKGLAMAGIGKPPYSFFADGLGRASYSGMIEANELGNGQTIKIVGHKDSVAENIGESNLVTVFLIDVKEFLSGKKSTSEGKSLIKPKISTYKGPLKHKVPEASSY